MIIEYIVNMQDRVLRREKLLLYFYFELFSHQSFNVHGHFSPRMVYNNSLMSIGCYILIRD